ncbi:hypothetical protein GCM10011386_00960 [Parapedobacter defluvii]|uniref:Uncharacterized protein n=1 Tax=Parapedobacter defluvii TaxID=2045106 RepID=A0ABQ1L027_9SPHI|nr:hypothetical protein [Parapedobacter defluvii]GGC13156.1 hypothetical protein GCM10011386_00960 [Parapedobacter defluvii]
MTETYTSKHPTTHGIIRKLEQEPMRLDLDDELFYNFLKNEMDTLLRQPHSNCIRKITSYSKAGQTSLM